MLWGRHELLRIRVAARTIACGNSSQYAEVKRLSKALGRSWESVRSKLRGAIHEVRREHNLLNQQDKLQRTH